MLQSVNFAVAGLVCFEMELTPCLHADAITQNLFLLRNGMHCDHYLFDVARLLPELERFLLLGLQQ